MFCFTKITSKLFIFLLFAEGFFAQWLGASAARDAVDAGPQEWRNRSSSLNAPQETGFSATSASSTVLCTNVTITSTTTKEITIPITNTARHTVTTSKEVTEVITTVVTLSVGGTINPRKGSDFTAQPTHEREKLGDCITVIIAVTITPTITVSQGQKETVTVLVSITRSSTQTRFHTNRPQPTTPEPPTSRTWSTPPPFTTARPHLPIPPVTIEDTPSIPFLTSTKGTLWPKPTITAGPNQDTFSAFIIGGKTLTMGGTLSISGTQFVLPPGHTVPVAFVGGVAVSTLSELNPIALSKEPVGLNPHFWGVVVGVKTLTSGGTVISSGTTYILPFGATAPVILSNGLRISTLSNQFPSSLVPTIQGQRQTLRFSFGGKILFPGENVVISGITYTLPLAATAPLALSNGAVISTVSGLEKVLLQSKEDQMSRFLIGVQMPTFRGSVVTSSTTSMLYPSQTLPVILAGGTPIATVSTGPQTFLPATSNDMVSVSSRNIYIGSTNLWKSLLGAGLTICILCVI